MGDVPFSIYYDFETGSVVFFDAKMDVVSYFIGIAFHPDLNIPRLVVFRSYDQTPDKLSSLTNFQALEYNLFANKEHFNKVTLKQLQDAVFLSKTERKILP